MELSEIIKLVAAQGVPSILCIFLIWNNAKLIDRVMDKLLSNGNEKKK